MGQLPFDSDGILGAGFIKAGGGHCAKAVFRHLIFAESKTTKCSIDRVVGYWVVQTDLSISNSRYSAQRSSPGWTNKCGRRR